MHGEDKLNMISLPTSSTGGYSYDTSNSCGDQEESLTNQCRHENDVLSCLDILSSDFTYIEEAEKNLDSIIKDIDNCYENVITLSRKYSNVEKTMGNSDQVLFENSLKNLYDSLFTKDTPENSFAKLWFSRNFANAKNEKRLQFLDEFFSLIKSAENLYSSKSLDTSKIYNYSPIVTDLEFKKLYMNLTIALTAYRNLSTDLEDEEEIKNDLEKMYFLFFPDTANINYKNWVDRNLTGSSERKIRFVTGAIDMCKNIKSNDEEKLRTHTSSFSGEKFSRLVAFICEELNDIGNNCISNTLSESILDSLIKNNIHNLNLFKCKKSSNIPKLKHLQDLSSQCIWKLYKNNYDKIGKDTVKALISIIATSAGKIHNSNEAVSFIDKISVTLNLKTISNISCRSLSEESSLVLYSQIPESIRKEMFNILRSQSQKTSMLEKLEEKIKLMLRRKDELSDVIRKNISESNIHTAELEGLLCECMVSSLRQENVSNDGKNLVVATRLTLDKLKALSRFIENNGGIDIENRIFSSTKDLLSNIEFEFSLSSPKVAHEISTILTRFEHPQSEYAKQKSDEIIQKSEKRIYHMALDDIRNRLLSSKNNEEKFKSWLHIAKKIEIESHHVTEGKEEIENLLLFTANELSTQELNAVRTMLYDINTSLTTLEFINNRCRSTIIKDTINSLSLWKKSFGATNSMMLAFFRILEKPQAEWKKIICEILNLYYNDEHDYFYQVNGPLPNKVLIKCQEQCLPNTSNGVSNHIRVNGKEFTIPHSVWLDITRSIFIVQEKTIVTNYDNKTGVSHNEVTHAKIKAMIKEIDKLNIPSEALSSLLALMNQNTAAQLLDAAMTTSICIFPEESKLSSSPSMSEKTIYSVVKTPEGELILTCSIQGKIKALQKLPQGVSRKVGDKNYLEDAEPIPLNINKLPDGKFPDQSANMKIRINDDGTVEIIEIRHLLTNITPSVVNNLIEAENY